MAPVLINVCARGKVLPFRSRVLLISTFTFLYIRTSLFTLLACRHATKLLFFSVVSVFTPQGLRRSQRPYIFGGGRYVIRSFSAENIDRGVFQFAECKLLPAAIKPYRARLAVAYRKTFDLQRFYYSWMAVISRSDRRDPRH